MIDTPGNFWDKLMLDVYHKRTGRSYPTGFYIFKDTANPLNPHVLCSNQKVRHSLVQHTQQKCINTNKHHHNTAEALKTHQSQCNRHHHPPF